MLCFVYGAVFVLGLLVGSFLNVLVLRWNTGLSIARGRSVCFSCGARLSWYELIPVLSFAIQGGRCRSCRAKISWQYPLVELASGLLFMAALFLSRSSYEFLLVAALFSTYLAIAVYDLRHQIIPDAFSYAAGLITLGLIGLDWHMTGSVDFYRIVAGPALFSFYGLFWLVSRGRWMGLGDGKLALSVGWALGLSQGAAATLLSFWIGAVFSLCLIAVQKLCKRGEGGLSLKSAVPFGPFILLGFLISALWGVSLGNILAFLAL
jgi:leader peptidase (prepilin peptidase)/N-methyltransferase